MIVSFSHPGLKQFYNSGRIEGLSTTNISRLRRLLSTLDQINSVADLNTFSTFKPQRLTGMLEGFWAIEVDAPFSLTFRIYNTNTELVDYTDLSQKREPVNNPAHPGEILQEEFLKPADISVSEAARRLGVSRVALSRVLHGHAAITPNLAVRLESSGAGTAQLWLNLQAAHSLAQVRQGRIPEVEPLN